MSTKG